MLNIYRHSGRFEVLSLAIMLPILLAAACVVGVAYQLLVDMTPEVKLTWILAAAAAVAMGWIAGVVLRLAKCRSFLAALVIGVAAGLACDAVSHGVAYYQLNVRAQSRGILGPSEWLTLDEYLEVRVRAGWHLGKSSSRTDVSGWGVWTVWSFEALTFAAASAYFAVRPLRMPFCEACRRWAVVRSTSYTIPSVHPKAPMAVMKATTTAQVLVGPEAIVASPMPMVDSGLLNGTQYRSLIYQLHTCPTCDKSQFLTASLQTVTQVGPRDVRTKTSRLVANVMLTPEEADGVRTLAMAIDPANARRS